MIKGLEYVNVVEAIENLHKLIAAYCVIIGYDIITKSNQET
jgi:hypothetical protein